MSALIVLVLISFFHQTWACEVIIPDRFSLAISPHTGDFFSYGNSNNIQPNANILISNCEKEQSEKKFLMIAFGPQNLEFSNRIGIYDFTNNYRDSGCFIERSFFKDNRDFPTRKEDLNSKWNTIKSCIDVTLKEIRNGKIEYPEKQPGCSITPHSPSKVSFNGGICFFKPQRESQYEVSFKVKDECRNYDQITKLGLTQFDFQALLNFYLAGDASGSSVNLHAIGSSPIRFTIAPKNSLVPLSDDFGSFVPQFPSYLELPDLHFGELEIEQSIPGKVHVRPTFWVDHNCPKKCHDNFCQSVCYYAQPFFGQVDLYKLSKNGKWDLLESWFDGGIAEPRFQGELRGSGIEIDENLFIKDTKYRLTINFTDPKADFDDYKGSLFRKLGTIQNLPTSLGRGSIPEIGRIQEIPERGKIPIFSSIPDLNFGFRLSSKFDDNIRMLSNQFNYQSWPPYLTKVCQDEACTGVSRKNYLHLNVDFTYLGNEPENKFNILYDNLQRRSTLSREYDIQNPIFPKIQCPFKTND